MRCRQSFRSGCNGALFLWLLFSFSAVQGQSIRRQAIVSFGGSVTQDGITLQSSAGQSSLTVPVYDCSAGLRPGFIQPNLSMMASDGLHIENLRVFPNPAHTFGTLDFALTPDDEIHIVDLMGRVMAICRPGDFTSQTRLDFTAMAHGTYLLQLYRNQILIGYAKLIKL